MNPASIVHSDVLHQLAKLANGRIPGWRQQTLGHSVEGRALTMVSVGTGDIPVLLWSQMHGDEPTHTTVLLKLLEELADDAESETTRSILHCCTLHVIPMLNPDGAQRWTRRNAQDIDINRDALHRQTPEANALWSAVHQVQPSFAFNLHNQHRRTAVGGTQHGAAVSLLVPPVDAAGTETAGTLAARRVAGVFCQAVRDCCPGMISRYLAEFMPRAFGEVIQQTGCSTVLVEAGDWLGHSPRELVVLHQTGLRAALVSIATSTYRDVPVTVYNDLPRNSEHQMFDRKVRDMWLLSGTGIAPLRGDLGVHFDSSRVEKYPVGHGTIEDLGDLRESRGATEWSIPHGFCTPGCVTVDPQVTPTALPDEATFERLLGHGVTLLVGLIDLRDQTQLAALSAMQGARFPIHVGFVARSSDWSDVTMCRYLPTALDTVLAVVVNDGLPLESDRCPQLHVPLLSQLGLPTRLPPRELPFAELPNWTARVTAGLGIHRYSVMRRGASADLLFFGSNGQDDAGTVRFDQLERVIVGGTLVWEHGRLMAELPGRLVR